MPGNYYQILGVPADATTRQIRAAFRRRARELHPDVSGLGSEPFLKLFEAYSVLSQPERRRQYDRQLAAARSRRTGRARPPAEPLVRARPPAEAFTLAGSAHGQVVPGWPEHELIAVFHRFLNLLRPW